MNRFSKDIGSIDGEIMPSLQYFVRMVVKGIIILCVISFITPVFLIVIVPVCNTTLNRITEAFVYLYIARRYLECSRELKRLESVARSPIYSLFSETLTFD